mmetsp:Transcript_20468/g.36943  ORF Transcript_20468/g.36943 Transcript_20468/m.36943 type:complete len:100 (+) Transcript_20468:252-551(+)
MLCGQQLPTPCSQHTVQQQRRKKCKDKTANNSLQSMFGIFQKILRSKRSNIHVHCAIRDVLTNSGTMNQCSLLMEVGRRHWLRDNRARRRPPESSSCHR